VRFPSLDLLLRHAVVVLRRFPWTLGVGALAAFAGINGSLSGTDEAWERLAFVAALGLPLTIALALLGEARRWPLARRHLVVVASLLALTPFFLTWPGMERRHDAIHYFQLSAALHLCTAFLPFLGAGESVAFWQYNRRLFLGFLRAALFSGVLFVGVAIALGALDKLFGVRIPGEVYFRFFLIVALLVNTWIFLAVVPEDLHALEQDREYPRALKIFAQYILTPLAFTYLVILLAYLVKIVAGSEWPRGWIGWLVASVSVTGLLGFLLVHPLRAEPGEAWIRTYARWLFVGLIPTALTLLVAFWKRILPYGLTEPRVLGIVLGLWLLGIAVLFTTRAGASIRTIPVTLAAVLLLTLYGPLSLTRAAVNSQAERLAPLLEPGALSAERAREGSAALRFLMDHGAEDAIEQAIGRELPPVKWATLSRYGTERDSIGRMVMRLAGAEYVPEYAYQPDGWFHLTGGGPMRIEGYTWAVPITSNDPARPVLDGDTLGVLPESWQKSTVRVRLGLDTLVFDLKPVVDRYADSVARYGEPVRERIVVEEGTGRRRAALVLSNLSGQRRGDSLSAVLWGGTLLLGE
jgi:hypothetical protein